MAYRLSRDEVIDRLRHAAPAILPSLLLCDFGNLERELQQLSFAGVEALHFDVMDGHFAPNLTYGMPIVKCLRERSEMVFDAHLMIEAPERYVSDFYEAGADVITIHAEAAANPPAALAEIRKLGAVSGLAINPATPVAAIEHALPFCDLILVMSVEVGFGGQSFNEVALEKLSVLRKREEVRALLQVDGGVNAETIARCTEAGADLLVVGSAIFRSKNYADVVARLTELAETGTQLRNLARSGENK